MVVKELYALLGFKTDGASAAKAETVMGSLKAGLAVVAAAAAAVGVAIGKMVMDLADEADKIDEASQSIGIGTTQLQELAHAASFSSIGLDDLGQSLGLLSRKIADAARGSKEAQRALKGIAIKDSQGRLRAVDTVLGDIAEKFAGMPNGTQKTALALELFGRSGKRLIPFLNEGKDGIAQLREEAHRLGIVLDEKTIKQGARFNDNWDRFKKSIGGAKKAIIGELLGPLADLLDRVTKFVVANRDLIKQGLDEFFKKVGYAVSVVTPVFRAWWHIIETVWDLLNRLWNALGRLQKPLLILAAIVTALTSPWLILAGLTAFLVLLLEDFIVFLQGGNSMIGKFVEKLKEWLKPKEDDPWWMKLLKAVIVTLPMVTLEIVNAVAHWKETLRDFFDFVEDGFKFLGGGTFNFIKFPGAGERKSDKSWAQAMQLYSNNVQRGLDLQRSSASLPMGGSSRTVNAPLSIGNITVNAPTGDAFDIAKQVRKQIEEHHATVLRTAAAGT